MAKGLKGTLSKLTVRKAFHHAPSFVSPGIHYHPGHVAIRAFKTSTSDAYNGRRLPEIGGVFRSAPEIILAPLAPPSYFANHLAQRMNVHGLFLMVTCCRSPRSTAHWCCGCKPPQRTPCNPAATCCPLGPIQFVLALALLLQTRPTLVRVAGVNDAFVEMSVWFTLLFRLTVTF